MIRKINIFLVLLLLIVSITAVSAADDGNITDIISNEANQDTLTVSVSEDINNLELTDNDELASATHTVNSANYNQYFRSSDGKLISSNVNDGDTINLDGSFSNVKFTFDKKVNIIGTSNNNMKNVMISLLKGSSGSSIANLNIANNKGETTGVFLNAVSNCTVDNCIINNTGKSSYCIAVVNGATFNKITNNDLQAYGVTYGHGTRSTPPVLLSGSHYNTVANNNVQADDANAIYLSSYDASPIHPGGISNFNTIINNTIKYNVLPTSWSYGIQIMGNNNTIKANKVIGAYRGISSSGSGNIIIENTIINVTGADYNHINVETGGEYAIVGAYNAIIANNTIIGAKIISTGAGISVIDNSVVENNNVDVTLKGKGIAASGSNVIVKNNIIHTESGSGVYEKDEGSGLLVENNNITSESGVGILIEKLSSKRMPKNVTIIKNTISTSNKYAIDASGVQADTSEIEKNVIIGSGLISSPSGVYDASKPTYNYKGTTYTITPTNIRNYINDNGGLTSEVKDGDILSFEGTFSNEVIYITKGVKITGKNPTFYNSTFKVTSGNVLIENLNIINKEAERVNAWGIFVNQASGVRINNNKISVTDPKAAYAIYVLQSTDVDVWNNELYSEGDYLTFTLLSYASEDCSFANNTIKTKGTGEIYTFDPEKCIDGNELVINGRSYCFDGGELVIDGKTYCLDGNELVIDGKKYCIDGEEFVIDGNTYCLDGNELVINGQSYTLTNKEITVNGTTYCLDGNEVVIDGKSYCLDGNELIIDGVRYCVDGNEYTTDGAHVVSEIYQTYSILLLYSSNNQVSRNNVDVTSKVTGTHPTTGTGASQNSIVGIDLYFNSHNNTFSENTINVKSNDNYIYGMGVLGYNTGHAAPEGQGATNNQFIGNKITLDGTYFTTGIIVGDESETTVLKDNVITAKSDVSYGITLEMSQKSTIENNTLTLNAQVIYLTQAYGSSDNIISNNVFNGDGKYVWGIVISNGNNNKIKDNEITANGNGQSVTFKNLDSIELGNAGLYLRANSTNNEITGNNISSAKNYAIVIDNTAQKNIISDNFLSSEKGKGNNAINNTVNNTNVDNYQNIASLTYTPINVEYLGTAEFRLTFGSEANGAVVEFYDIDNVKIGQATVSTGAAVLKYALDDSYIPSQYVFTAKFTKDGFKSSTHQFKFQVTKTNLIITLNDFAGYQGETIILTAKVTNKNGEPVKGVSLQFNRVSSRLMPIGSKAITDENGIAKVTYEIPASLNGGTHNITADIAASSNYNAGQANAKLTVKERLDVTITINKGVYTNGVLATLKDSQGNPIVNINGTVKIGSTNHILTTNSNGEIILPDGVNQGVYQITITSSAQGKYSEKTQKETVKIINPIIGGKNFSVYYGNTVKYKVQIIGLDGKAVGSGKAVTFKINGKSKTVKTDKNGYATYSAKLKAGTYTITASYAGSDASNKIVFKPTLTAKNIVKKKAKTIKFTTKLVDKKGKVLKNKKITFKVNGKKITAKTNKKGVATASIKNLKVGKFTITSSYGGCTIKNTIQIKK